MFTLFQDLRFAVRYLRKQGSFTAATVLTIALGIGINTALFTVFNAFFLKPLPLKDPSRLVTLEGRDKQSFSRRLFSYADYLDYQQQNAQVAELVAWNKVDATLGDAPPEDADDFILADGYEHIFGQIVSTNYFKVLGAQMYLGRTFTSNEDTEAGCSEIVLSHAYWQRHYKSDAAIVGKEITLKGHSFTIIGITEPGFIGTTPDSPSFWVPLLARDFLIQAGSWGHNTWRTDRNFDAFTLLARIQPNISEAQAQAAFQVTANRLAEQYPNENRKAVLSVERAGTFVTLSADVASLVVPIAIGFGLVLLVACANVANLLLARSMARRREIGVRVALGARRSRIVRQLLTESILLAGLGGAVGLLIAIWTLRIVYTIILSSLSSPELAAGFTLDLFPDSRVFVFTLSIAALAGVVAGLAPAIQVSRPDVIGALKDETSGPFSKSRLRNGLVVGQIAVSLSLLIAAGLLVVNAYGLRRVDTGMNIHNVFSVAGGLTGPGNENNEGKMRALKLELASRLRALPDVVSVSEAFNQPLSGSMGNRLVMLNGDNAGHPIETAFNFVSADYFRTLSINIVRGRPFCSDDVRSRVPVVVVSETAAKEFWPGRDPIGQKIAMADEGDEVRYRRYEVVGVARDTRSRHVWSKDERFLYVPLPDLKSRYLLVQTRGNPSPTISLLGNLSTSIDPKLRTSVRLLEDSLKMQTIPFQALGWVSAVLGSLALMLAALGLYGVTSFVVARRTHEIGIRMALGARRRDVLALFLREGLKLTAIGIVIGLSGGVALSRLLVSVLVDLSAVDPLLFALVSLFLFFVATLTILAATLRATRVDPLVALRYE